MSFLYCAHCEERATWSRLLDQYWCSDCRSVDVVETEDEEGEA
jgi:hypothetical protein